MPNANHEAKKSEVLDSIQKDFFIEEYKSLRSELSSMNDIISRIYKFLLLALAGIYSWILTSDTRLPNVIETDNHSLRHSVGNIVWYVPIILVVFSFLAMVLVAMRMSAMSKYLKKLEDLLGRSREIGMGWERNFDSWRAWYRNGYIAFYIMLLILTMCMTYKFTA